MDILTNPYVIIFIVVAVVVSNIMALKYTAKSKLGMRQKEKKKTMRQARNSQRKPRQLMTILTTNPHLGDPAD